MWRNAKTPLQVVAWAELVGKVGPNWLGIDDFAGGAKVSSSAQDMGKERDLLLPFCTDTSRPIFLKLCFHVCRTEGKVEVLWGLQDHGTVISMGMCIKKKLITESKKYYLRNQQQIN